MKEERVTFPCGDISLEGVLGLPEGESPFQAVVICHPHPLYGGNMDNSVVYAVCDALGRESIAWLRFNFRGVGRSGGHFADGIGEQDDVKAALSFLSIRNEIDSTKLGLCGYSFGTMVAIPVADVDERVEAIAGISPFFNSPDLLKQYTKPKFFICGTNDEFVNHKEVEDIIGALTEPKSFESIPRADHFWWGYEGQVGARVAGFFISIFK